MSRALLLGLFALVGALLLVWRGTAAAQPATGTITGRVLWGSCARVALPLAPDAQAVPGMESEADAAQALPPEVLPAPGVVRPTPQRALPAGAVLVAVQNTSISGRTDEAGRFTLAGVPAGQYLTVAAGPVANSLSAVAQRPNMFVNGGETVSAGTLVLGGASLGVVCRPFLPGAVEGAEPEAEP